LTGGEAIVALLSIVVIDIVLGGDNAVLIALASKALPPDQRKKAMFWGVAGAVGIRAALTCVALYVLKIPLLQFTGGILLAWIAIKLLSEERKVRYETGKSLAEAIKIIIVADAIMGIDNVIAIAGAAHGSVLMVLLGLAISVPVIMWGSTFILRFMDRYPFIMYLGAGVLAWTAGQMMAEDKVIYRELGAGIPYFEILVPVLILVIVMAIGYYRSRVPVDTPS